jgi:sulfate-transporting ATPase
MLRFASLFRRRLMVTSSLSSAPPFIHARWNSSKKKGKPPVKVSDLSKGAAESPTVPNSASGGSGPDNGRGAEGDVCMSLRDVGKTLPGGRVLFSRVNLAFNRGAKIGVLGLNGAGKSSLLKILSGMDTEFDGTAWLAPGLRVGYLAQEPTLDDSRSVHDNIMDGLQESTTLLARFDELSAAMGEEGADIDALLAEQADIQSKIEAGDLWNLAHVVAAAKEALRVPKDDAAVVNLSGGERRRVALCRLLLSKPHVLLLDEPTNHLDATSVAWLERFLAEYRGTVLAVTHDRYFLDNVAGWILEVSQGSTL